VTAEPGEDQMLDALAAFATLPEWLAAATRRDRVAKSLVRHVPELADGQLTLVTCASQGVRAQGSNWLARYSVHVRSSDGETREIVLVGTLRAPRQSLPSWTPPVTADPAFGEPGWRGALPDLGLELRVEDHDEALPSLPMLVEPVSAAHLLGPVLRQAGYDGATITSCDPVVVRYKPGSRCTVVTHLGYVGRFPGPTPVVLKTHQGDKGATAWAAMNALWDRRESWEHAVRLAEPLAYLREERILVQGPVPGDVTLKELAREAIAGGEATHVERLRDGLAKAAFALATVHASGASYDRTATFEDKLAEVAEVVNGLSLSVPELSAAAAPLLRHLTDRAAAGHPDPAVAAHHDFRPDQILVDGGRVGFIDFDSACMAEPALDLGRFCAALRDVGISALWLSGEQPPAERAEAGLRLLNDLCEHFLAEYHRHAPVSRSRVELWETWDLMNMMLHAWTKVRARHIRPRLWVLMHRLRMAQADGISPCDFVRPSGQTTSPVGA
jgi:hypothetical protein